MDINSRFKSIDANADGSLSLDEFLVALDSARLSTPPSSAKAMFDDIDADRSGTISLEEFTTFCNERERALRAVYDEIVSIAKDEGATHCCGITAQMWRVAASKCDVVLSEAEIKQVVDHLDRDGDSVISFEEFRDGLLFSPCVSPQTFFDTWSIHRFANAQSATSREPESFQLIVAKKLMCGGVAGFLSRTMTAPFDRLRILMMTAGSGISISTAFAMATKGGWHNLWIGNGVNCLKITPEMAIKLLTFDLMKSNFSSDPSNISVGERFFAGGVAGALSQGTVYPLEVIRTRLSVAKPGEYNSIVDCAKRTLASGGPRAFYAGITPSIMGIIPYAAIDLSLNSILKERAVNNWQKDRKESSVVLLLGCGMVSSAVATLATYPLYVIRTNAQATAEPVQLVVSRIFKSGGFTAFYRGVVPCMTKVMPATSISYASYEYMVRKWSSVFVQ